MPRSIPGPVSKQMPGMSSSEVMTSGGHQRLCFLKPSKSGEQFEKQLPSAETRGDEDL